MPARQKQPDRITNLVIMETFLIFIFLPGINPPLFYVNFFSAAAISWGKAMIVP
jgi:hypothetical protein